jgi:hypothetical protein
VRAWLESLPVLLDAAIFLGGFTVATMLAGLGLAKIVPHDVRREHNDLAGFILAVIGIVYAVLLAFVAFGVWQRFDQAESRVYDEAGMLTIVYRDASSFGLQSRRLRGDIRDYARTVAREEWATMASGGSSQRARAQIETVDREIRDLPATTRPLQNIQAQMLSSIEESLVDRDARLSMSATGVNGVMWIVLVLGAMLTVGFTYLFGFRHMAMQQRMP